VDTLFYVEEKIRRRKTKEIGSSFYTAAGNEIDLTNKKMIDKYYDEQYKGE